MSTRKAVSATGRRDRVLLIKTLALNNFLSSLLTQKLGIKGSVTSVIFSPFPSVRSSESALRQRDLFLSAGEKR